jgi:non-specific serine/threonine protein kinase
VPHIYLFGPLRLDAQTSSLTLNGRPTGLGPRAVQLLHALVARANEYVSKAELLEAAWPGLVVEEANLSVQMSSIRKVLGQSGGSAVKIETLARRGYRLVGSVTTEGARPAHNLPEALTSFVGRERQIEEIKGLFPTTRLLTLTGPGGAGKTRLALQVAADLLASRSDGVWLTELAAVTDPDRVAQTVAVALGVAEQTGKGPTQALIEHLATRRLVLVLDNAEHVLAACAELVHAVLRHCADVAVLATSREPLGVSGELVYRVPPMTVPDPKRATTPDDIARYESVHLFVERACLHLPGFEMTVDNAPAVASVCHRLDGIPLSLELAAARVRSMTVEEIDSRLDQRFRLLTGGARTSLPRQQTLRSLIDWSVGLLEEAEKALLFRSSVFAGGWTLEAAELVCVGAPIADETAVVVTLTALVDKSLVLAETRGRSTRFRLLETVRQYARASLEEGGDASRWRSRHLDHFVHIAEAAEPHLTGSDQQIWLDRLELEHDNVRAALASSLGVGGDVASGLRLAGAFGRFWQLRGFLREGRDWLSRLLAAPQLVQARNESRAKGLLRCAFFVQHQGDYPAAQAMLQESLAIWRELDDRRGMGAALNNLGTLAYLRGDYPRAHTLYDESLAARRAVHDLPGIAGSLNNLGNLAYLQGDYATARAQHEESLGIERRVGNRWGIATSLHSLGLALEEQGDSPGARAAFEESLAMNRELGNRQGVGNALISLGNDASEHGDYGMAQRRYQEALEIHRELGDQECIAAVLDNLALVAAEQGNHAEARSLSEQALTIRAAIDDRRGIAWSLEGLAYATFALGGGPARAARIWGAASRLREEVGCPLPSRDRARSDRRIAAARAAMADDAAFEQAWQDGRTTPLEQAVELALRWRVA